MGKLALATLALLLAPLAVPLGGAAQGYQPLPEANPKDVYCSGFLASEPVPDDLRIVMGEDAVGRLAYTKSEYVYLGKGADGDVSVGQRYLVVRPFNNPDSPEAESFDGEHKYTRQMTAPWYKNEYAGQFYQDIGRVEVKYVHPTTATALVTHACDPLNPGDILVPFAERPVPEYKPLAEFDRFAPPSGLATGVIVPGKDFAYMFGTGDVIYATIGVEQGVQVGDYVRLYHPASGTEYKGYKDINKGQWRSYRGVPEGTKIPRLRQDLPLEVAAEALVLRAEPKSSTAVITHAVREVHAGDFAELQPPAAPAARLTVVPESIPRGGTATLSWSAQLAQEIEIRPGIGAVTERTGSTNVGPSQTITYTLTVRGRGGEAQDTATLTVVQPPPPPPPPPLAPAEPSLQELFSRNVRDIFFEFDRATITPQAAAILQRSAEFLLAYPQVRVLLEGHCDEIGTAEYNMRLGVRRARATKDYLVSLGVPAEQLDTVSLGKTQPFCTESTDEPCRRINRRTHFVLQR